MERSYHNLNPDCNNDIVFLHDRTNNLATFFMSCNKQHRLLMFYKNNYTINIVFLWSDSYSIFECKQNVVTPD